MEQVTQGRGRGGGGGGGGQAAGRKQDDRRRRRRRGRKTGIERRGREEDEGVAAFPGLPL